MQFDAMTKHRVFDLKQAMGYLSVADAMERCHAPTQSWPQQAQAVTASWGGHSSLMPPQCVCKIQLTLCNK